MLDVRGSKLFHLGQMRLRVNIDFFNVLNRSDIINLNNTYGPQYRIPVGSIAALGTLGGRRMKMGVELNEAVGRTKRARTSG